MWRMFQCCEVVVTFHIQPNCHFQPHLTCHVMLLSSDLPLCLL